MPFSPTVYPSESVFESVLILYEIFLKIDSSSRLSRLFYEGSCRRNLVQLANSMSKRTIVKFGGGGVFVRTRNGKF